METTWFILREPGRVPELKSASNSHAMAFLRDLMEVRPAAIITVLTIDEDRVPMVQDGPECLEMLSSRHRGRARRHRASTKAAFAASR